jgi:hypothetical protein
VGALADEELERTPTLLLDTVNWKTVNRRFKEHWEVESQTAVIAMRVTRKQMLADFRGARFCTLFVEKGTLRWCNLCSILATEGPHPFVPNHHIPTAVFSMLDDRPLDINAKDSKGRSPILLACTPPHVTRTALAHGLADVRL